MRLDSIHILLIILLSKKNYKLAFHVMLDNVPTWDNIYDALESIESINKIRSIQ